MTVSIGRARGRIEGTETEWVQILWLLTKDSVLSADALEGGLQLDKPFSGTKLNVLEYPLLMTVRVAGYGEPIFVTWRTGLNAMPCGFDDV